MSIEAMKLALEALEDVQEAYGNHSKWFKDRVDALRQAIEQAEQQEPVAWATSLDFDDDDQEIIPAKDKGKLGTSNCDIPLYTAPPKQWVGLTGDEVNEFAAGCHLGSSVQGAIRKAEAKLKEKNT